MLHNLPCYLFESEAFLLYGGFDKVNIYEIYRLISVKLIIQLLSYDFIERYRSFSLPAIKLIRL